MSKTRLIKRLKWYYPTEKFHTYITFPVLLLYLLLTNPIRNIILLSYGLIVCIVILFQGQYYWKLKLNRLKGEYLEQDNNTQFFKKSKRLNWIMIRALKLVFAKSEECSDDLPKSMTYAFGYTFFFVGWLIGIIYISTLI